MEHKGSGMDRSGCARQGGRAGPARYPLTNSSGSRAPESRGQDFWVRMRWLGSGTEKLVKAAGHARGQILRDSSGRGS